MTAHIVWDWTADWSRLVVLRWQRSCLQNCCTSDWRVFEWRQNAVVRHGRLQWADNRWPGNPGHCWTRTSGRESQSWTQHTAAQEASAAGGAQARYDCIAWWKNFEDMYNCLDRISACDGQMDRQTDILPRHSLHYAYASRDKNSTTCKIVTHKILIWNFACVITSWMSPTMQLLDQIGTLGDYPQNVLNVRILWLFVVLSFSR